MSETQTLEAWAAQQPGVQGPRVTRVDPWGIYVADMPGLRSGTIPGDGPPFYACGHTPDEAVRALANALSGITQAVGSVSEAGLAVEHRVVPALVAPEGVAVSQVAAPLEAYRTLLTDAYLLLLDQWTLPVSREWLRRYLRLMGVAAQES